MVNVSIRTRVVVNEAESKLVNKFQVPTRRAFMVMGVSGAERYLALSQMHETSSIPSAD